MLSCDFLTFYCFLIFDEAFNWPNVVGFGWPNSAKLLSVHLSVKCLILSVSFSESSHLRTVVVYDLVVLKYFGPRKSNKKNS